MSKVMTAAIGMALAAGLASPGMAAGENAMKVCGARYQAAKAGKTLPVGQTWNGFLAACRGSLGKPAVTSAAAHQPTTGQVAMRSRQQACAKQWQVDKAAGKTAGQTWPKYWSQCSALLKG